MTAFTFIEPGVDGALVSTPTFRLIPHYLRLCGARLQEVRVLDSLDFDHDTLEVKLYSGIKLVMLASPDNPTGKTLDKKRLVSWLEAYRGTLFFIDEAYAEYGQESMLELVSNFENLIVSRTFSKGWGLAGLRLGFVAGSPTVIEALNRVRIPFNVNSAAVHTVLKNLPRRTSVEAAAAETLQRGRDFAAQLEERGFTVSCDSGNFLLLDAGIDAQPLAAFLMKENVYVKHLSSSKSLEGKVRITIGTEVEMEQLLVAIDTWRSKTALIFDLDDTLVDTSKSYDEAVMQLVADHAGNKPGREDLVKVREQSGFNDDWRLARELLAQRNIKVDYATLRDQGRQLYLQLAESSESLLISPSNLNRLAQRYRLFILTGRYRDEYEPVWAERLNPLFERVYCVDDYADMPGKPAPDQLLRIISENDLEATTYIGNSVDDMTAAVAANVRALGVTSTTSAEKLLSFGADRVISQVADLPQEFGQ